jgi:hypothetical protein
MRFSQAKQKSAIKLLERELLEGGNRNSEHLGYTPFQEDERNQDFVMGQEEFLNRSLHEDMAAQGGSHNRPIAAQPERN